jgi:alpha-N-arabinofuranosidase
MRGVTLNAHVACATYELKPEAEISNWPHRVADLSPFKLLDVTAVYNPEHAAFTIAVVNRDLAQAHTSTIQCAETFASAVESYELNAVDPNSTNSFADPHIVSIQQSSHDIGENQREFTYTFPAHSLTLLRLRTSG